LKEDKDSYFLIVHFCLPKNELKRAPRCPGPSDCLKFIPPCGVLLAVDGTLKNSPPAAAQTVPASFPPTAAMLSWDRMGSQRQTPAPVFKGHFTQPSSTEFAE